MISAGDVTVLVSERPSGGMDTLGGGRPEVLGGCLGAGGSVIVWLHGTKPPGVYSDGSGSSHSSTLGFTPT